MKVAIDGTPLTVSTGGIARYTVQLHQALAAEFPDDRFELLPGQPGRWWSLGLRTALQRGSFALFHGTDFAVPYFPIVPAVMTLHDLSPWHKAWQGETSKRVRLRTPWLLRLGRVASVITPTEAIRREAIGHFRLDPDRVRAVPHGVDPSFQPQPSGDASMQPYLLTVGTHGARKNGQTALAAARAAGIELWAAGRGDWSPQPGLRILGAVPDHELPAIYARAAAFLFPSHYEGFGLPLLEAMACGAPAIASNDAALREVSGGAALHCEAGDVRAWAEAIAAARANRGELASRGIARAAEFTWARTARLTREVYQEALCLGAR